MVSHTFPYCKQYLTIEIYNSYYRPLITFDLAKQGSTAADQYFTVDLELLQQTNNYCWSGQFETGKMKKATKHVVCICIVECFVSVT